MDPSHQRVEQSQVTLPHDDTYGDDNEGTESRNEIERKFDVFIELGLHSGNVFVENISHDSDIDVNNLNDFDEPDDDDFFVERRGPALEFRDITSTGSDIRLVTVESGFDDDDDEGIENEREIWGINLNEEDVYVNDDDDDDEEDEDDVSVTIPLCWDSLQVEDRGLAAEEFDWEEVDDGGGLADEREILTGLAEADMDDGSSVSISISPMISLEDLATAERTEGTGTVGWEVLLNSNTLEINFDVENRELYIVGDHEDYIHTTEYEMLFEQFAEAGITNLGLPPTSKSFIKDLPMVELDVKNDGGAVCAVCNDEMNIGSKVVRLPCNHKYHTECIVPWLRTRNTCPVCRYELPTDDAEYEQRKSQRTISSDDIW